MFLAGSCRSCFCEAALPVCLCITTHLLGPERSMRLPGEALPPTPRAAAPRFWWDMPPLPRMPLRAPAARGGGGGSAGAGGPDAAAAGAAASESEPGAEGGACDACSSPGSADRQKLLARVRALGFASRERL